MLAFRLILELICFFLFYKNTMRMNTHLWASNLCFLIKIGITLLGNDWYSYIVFFSSQKENSFFFLGVEHIQYIVFDKSQNRLVLLKLSIMTKSAITEFFFSFSGKCFYSYIFGISVPCRNFFFIFVGRTLIQLVNIHLLLRSRIVLNLELIFFFERHFF